jgi:hypothetical protein
MTSGTTHGHPVPQPATGRSRDWWQEKVRFTGAQGWMSDVVNDFPAALPDGILTA